MMHEIFNQGIKSGKTNKKVTKTKHGKLSTGSQKIKCLIASN